MKKKILLFAFWFSVISIASSAQSFPDPEFSSRPYSLEADTALKNLERADAQVDFKLKGLGYGGSETYFTTFTPKSGIRFLKNTLPKLIIKVDGNIDPSELISLSKAEVKKDRRKFLQSSIALGGGARDVSNTFLKIQFKKLREGIYEIILPKDIQPGEYGFIPMNTGTGNPLTSFNAKAKITCFGID
ncbi:MAG: hypothetical protein SGI96_22085 [Bacteroidota bacterium]|nr:hypothetical protein [Bacteroidota bacterium]